MRRRCRAQGGGAHVGRFAPVRVDQDYGSRDIILIDPDGNRWSLGTYAGASAGD
jgi:uncharacterized glyoxalase superfamily protein PhnB